MFLADKTASALHRLRTLWFKRSGQWSTHPLNVEVPPTDWASVDSELVKLTQRLPFVIRDFPVDADAYAQFKRRFWPGSLYAVGYKDKKIMEHFASFSVLGLTSGDYYIDIASEASPFPGLYRRLAGVEAFSQDLSYTPGVRGYEIGSSADELPVDAASVSKMSLHCSFEHFMNRIDTNFIRELSRTLRPGGTCVIVPLYFASRHLNIVDPLLYRGGIDFDDGALVVGETNLGGLFERYYSPDALERILMPGIGLSYEILRIGIPPAVRQAATPPLDRVRYALVVTKV